MLNEMNSSFCSRVNCINSRGQVILVDHVGFGSNSEVELADADFRFAPESGLKSDIAP
jgi:hypothetical protein